MSVLTFLAAVRAFPKPAKPVGGWVSNRSIGCGRRTHFCDSMASMKYLHTICKCISKGHNLSDETTHIRRGSRVPMF